MEPGDSVLIDRAVRQINQRHVKKVEWCIPNLSKKVLQMGGYAEAEAAELGEESAASVKKRKEKLRKMLGKQPEAEKQAALDHALMRDVPDMGREQAARERSVEELVEKLLSDRDQAFRGDCGPILSPPFEVGGLAAKVHLLFYPAGQMGAKPNACSLFVICPAGGCFLKGRLFVNDVYRDFENEFSSAGSTLIAGEKDFCNFVRHGYDQRNDKGRVREVWMHLPCREVFGMQRDSVTMQVLGTTAFRKAGA